MKKIFTLFTALTTFMQLQAQPGFHWAQSFGGYDMDWPYGIRLDNNTDVITIAGYKGLIDFDWGNDTVNIASSGGIILHKTNGNGQLQWAKKITKKSSAVPTLRTNPNNDIFIAGAYSGTEDFDPDTAIIYNDTAKGSINAYLLKLNASGNFQWLRTLKGYTSSSTNRAVFTAFDMDASGNMFITGFYRGTIDFDPGPALDTATSASIDNAFLLKLDANGNLVWVKRWSSPNLGFSNITCATNGDLLMTGSFQATPDFDPSSGVFNMTGTAGADMFVLRMDANGNFVWAKAFKGAVVSQYSNTATPLAVVNSTNNEILLSGYFHGKVDFDPSTGVSYLTTDTLNTTSFVLRLSMTGDLVWVKSFDGIDNVGNDITSDASGACYVHGYYGTSMDADPGTGTHNLPQLSSYNSNLYLVKLNASGDYVWSNNFGGHGFIFGKQMAFDEGKQEFYFTGQYKDTSDFDPGPNTNLMTSQGELDVYVMKVGMHPAGISSLTMQASNQFMVYPNPASNMLYIKHQVNENEMYEIKLYNFFGQQLYAERTNKVLHTLSIEQFPKGIYSLKLNQEVRRVVKE